MTELLPDYSFERKGVRFADWLFRLVSDDAAVRQESGDVLWAMRTGVPSTKIDWSSINELPDTARQMERFSRQIQVTLSHKHFDSAGFVQRLCEQVLARKTGASNADLMILAVFECLGKELLIADATIKQMMKCEACRGSVYRSLIRIGPAAVHYAPFLLRQMKHRPNVSMSDELAAPFAAIVRDDPQMIRRIVDHFLAGSWHMQRHAANVLIELGEAIDPFRDEVISAANGVFEESEDVWKERLIASVGRIDDQVRQCVLKAAGPQPPDLQEFPNFPGHFFDAAMGRRAAALESLRFFTKYPDETVPVLIEALSSFEEFDPDECYDGPVGRVAGILADFGPSASEAAVPLARLMLGAEEFPGAIIDALTAIGPAASGALPLLYKYQTKYLEEEPLSEPLDRILDPIGWAIGIIEGRIDP